MAVERKTQNINFIASFFMIIVAGSLYRVTNLNRKLMHTQITNIL